MRDGERLLQEASDIIQERGENYGSPLDNFTRIAKFWSVLFDVDIKPEQVGLAMDLVKTARLMETPDHHDSYMDKAGYVAANWEVIQDSKKLAQSTANLVDLKSSIE